MGLRGPAKTPTALTVLRGNPGKRALPKNEPQPREVPPYCPEHIRADKVALREWNRVLAILTQMRVVSEADYITLGNLCLAYSTMIAAQEKIAALNASGSGIGGLVVVVGKKAITRKTVDGTLVTTESPGFMQISPLLSIVSNSILTITKLCREFGLTPASRPGVKASPKTPDDDPWANL
jgi:P27 family predicted phage terminase small subunit